MLLSDLNNFMIKRGMRVYDSLFIIGPIIFLIIIFHTSSFVTAISILVFIWILAIAIYFCNRFEIGDYNGYSRNVKQVKQTFKGRLFNAFWLICILLIAYAGFFSGAFLGAMVSGNKGLVYRILGGLSAALYLKIFYIAVLKRIEIGRL